MKSPHEDAKKTTIQRAPKLPEVQRESTPEEDEEQKLQMSVLQRQVGNKAVQRLLAQREGGGPTDLDDETANRINNQRGGGQPLDASVQRKMGGAMNADLSGVRVHTSPEAGALNQDLGAQAFTTGKDIFFSEGAYQPGTSGGQELLAHELTHVVQQSSGMPSTGSGMQVNAPGDAYEQEAEQVSKSMVSRMEATEPEEEELQQ